jgi:nitrogen-specific signal transduction histidine kinase/CheY-like chemotaxis protein
VTPFPLGVRHGEVTIMPIFSGDRCTMLIGSAHDITRIREAEAERRAIEVQLQQSQRLQSLGTLASGIAHDFNNILAAIASNTELALENLYTQESLREIQHATARAATLVRRILAFGRKAEPQRERLDLAVVVDEALGLLRATLPSSIELVRRFAPGLSVLADRTQVHQVVMNLVTNAVHAMRGHGKVTITIELVNQAPSLAPGSYLRLAIADTGHGMDEATLARAFDPFFTTKPAGEGSGLGLSIVHGIMRSHDGAATIESEVGVGTTVSLYFPVAVGSLTGPRPGRGEHVMFVDDEDAIVFLGTRILTGLGYRVTGHTNPGAALEAFRAAPDSFDVVISDVLMPGMSGVTLLAEIRQIRRDIPVILTSGRIRPEDIEVARRYELDDPIPKPHTIEEFAWAVSRGLESRRRTA